jgi:hypothetical protein
MMVAGRGRDGAPRQPNEEVIPNATRSYIRTLRAKAEELRTIAAHTKSEHGGVREAEGFAVAVRAG